VPTKRNKRRIIVEEGSSSATQDEGGAAHQANKQPYGGIPMPPPSYGVCRFKHGGVGSHAATSSIIHGVQQSFHGAN
jgi:hypothetical protein